MYFFRILDVLRDDYSSCVALLGDDALPQPGHRLPAARPPSHPSLRNVGAQLPELPRAPRARRPSGRGWPSWRALERARLEVFDAADADRSRSRRCARFRPRPCGAPAALRPGAHLVPRRARRRPTCGGRSTTPRSRGARRRAHTSWCGARIAGLSSRARARRAGGAGAPRRGRGVRRALRALGRDAADGRGDRARLRAARTLGQRRSAGRVKVTARAALLSLATAASIVRSGAPNGGRRRAGVAVSRRGGCRRARAARGGAAGRGQPGRAQRRSRRRALRPRRDHRGSRKVDADHPAQPLVDGARLRRRGLPPALSIPPR